MAMAYILLWHVLFHHGKMGEALTGYGEKEIFSVHILTIIGLGSNSFAVQNNLIDFFFKMNFIPYISNCS